MIIKRTTIDNSIIKELQDKYPAIANKNDVSYKLGLNYYTFELEFMTSPLLQKLMYEYGHGVLILIHYLRSSMCIDGWKVRVDDFYLQFQLRDCAFKFNLSQENLLEIYKALIAHHIFYEVSDESCIEGTWVTCSQQIYNFEMANNQRQKDRARQQKKRNSTKGKKSDEKQELEYNPSNEDYPNYTSYPIYDEQPYYPTQEEYELAYKDYDENDCF